MIYFSKQFIKLKSIKSQTLSYLVSISWYMLSLVISNINDIIQKNLGQDLHPIQITFMRFLFGTLTLMPFMIFYGRQSFAISKPFVHVFRGGFLFSGIALYCYGLKHVHLTAANVINFTIPIFTLMLAIFFLKEKVGWARWLATMFGFIGIMVVIEPTTENFNLASVWLIIAAFLFAMLDITNKKYVVQETMLAMLFYTALVTMLFSCIPTFFVWKSLNLNQYILLSLVGSGANILLFCLLKSLRTIDASAVAPFRYIELLLASITGYYFFNEIPQNTMWLGAVIIIPSTLFIIYYDARQASLKTDS